MVGEQTPRNLLESAFSRLEASAGRPEVTDLMQDIEAILSLYQRVLTEEEAKAETELKATHAAMESAKAALATVRETFEKHFPPGKHRWWSSSTVRKWDAEKALKYLPAACFKMEVSTSHVAAHLKLGFVTQQQIDACSVEETQWSLRVR